MGTEVGEGEGLGMEWGCSNSFFSFDRIRCAVSAVKCIHKLMQCDASTCHSLHTYMHTSTTGYPIMGVRYEEIKAMPNTMVYKYMHCRTSTCTCTCNTCNAVLSVRVLNKSFLLVHACAHLKTTDDYIHKIIVR